MSEPTRKPPARPMIAVDPVDPVDPIVSVERVESVGKANGVTRLTSPGIAAPSDDKVLCDRCGAEMYRMHAVWRCQGCGYKTDCCGW